MTRVKNAVLLFFVVIAVVCQGVSARATEGAAASSLNAPNEIKWHERGPLYQVYPLAFADSNGDAKGDIIGVSAQETAGAASSNASDEIKWYERGPMYQIYPLAFADSNGDGKGDLRGIIEHVDHLKDIGVEAIWMNPIFKSPLKDNGYDIANFTEINPVFGTMEDLEELIRVYHENGIRILLDFVPNHTSDEHQWFKDSVKKINGKEDFYVWMDPKGYDSDGKPIPPNNWLALFQGSMWEWVEERKQFYLHQFGVYQVDLNFRNPAVIEALKEIMRFWLRKGIDGFRVDAVLYLIENHYDLDKQFLPGCTAIRYGCQEMVYTINQLENYDIVKQFSDVLEEDEFKGRDLINFMEAYTTQNLTFMFYDRQNVPFNFQLLDDLSLFTNASVFENAAQSWLRNMPQGKWPNWVAGNHDNSRIATKHGPELVDAMNMVILLLPGLPVSYQGEEIGMTDMNIRTDLQIDVSSFDRDPERTPMQWNDSLNAGFTSAARSFLPVNPNYWNLNVNSENNAQNSHLKIYKRIVKLHKELINSTREPLKTHVLSTWVYSFERPNHIIIINLNQIPEQIDLRNVEGLPDNLYVKIPSVNAGFNDNDVVSTKQNFTMRPRSGVVFSFQQSNDASSSSSSSSISFLLLLPLFLAYVFQ